MLKKQNMVGDCTSVQPVSTSLLIIGDLALAQILGTSVTTVRRWREARLIPYTKTGHRSIHYKLERVLSALAKLEVHAVSEKGVR
jgi:hypothetical protein